jgi:hypothetical protein
MDANLQIWLEAFANLLEQLNRVLPSDFEQTEPDLKTERGHCHHALIAVATFIGTFDKRHSKRFFDLASNFEKLNRGHSVSLFEPAVIYDRPQDPPQVWMARARAVLAIEALVRTGTKPGKAVELIATENPQIREFAGAKAAKTPLENVLRNWRKEFQRKEWRAGSPKRLGLKEGLLVFEEGIKEIDEWLKAGRRDEVLAIAQNVYEAAKGGGVFSPPATHC